MSVTATAVTYDTFLNSLELIRVVTSMDSLYVFAQLDAATNQLTRARLYVFYQARSLVLMIHRYSPMTSKESANGRIFQDL